MNNTTHRSQADFFSAALLVFGEDAGLRGPILTSAQSKRVPVRQRARALH